MDKNIELYKGNPLINKAFEDYLDLGSARSVLVLHRKYREKAKEDPTALIPTLDLDELTLWENQYDWKLRAFEYDDNQKQLFLKNRKEVLDKVYDAQFSVGEKLAKKAEKALEDLKPEHMSAGDILKYSTEGMRLQKESVEKKKELAETGTGGSANDYWAGLREGVFLAREHLNSEVQPLKRIEPESNAGGNGQEQAS